MNPMRRLSIVCAAAICAVFSLAFAIMVIAAANATHNPFNQLVLVSVGSALLAAGLVIVLVQAFMMVATATPTPPSFKR